MTPPEGIPCAGYGREEDVPSKEEKQEEFPSDALEGGGCSALRRIEEVSPAN